MQCGIADRHWEHRLFMRSEAVLSKLLRLTIYWRGLFILTVLREKLPYSANRDVYSDVICVISAYDPL
jgi:hypothetical protein